MSSTPTETSEKQSVPARPAAPTPSNEKAQEWSRLATRARRGLGWFYVIALLNLIGALILLGEANADYSIGLAAPLIAHFVSAQFDTPIVGLAVAVPFSALFAVLGYFCLKGNRAAACIGVVLYLGDASFFLLAGDVSSAALHGVILLFLLRGLFALLKLHGQGAFLPRAQTAPVPATEQPDPN